MTKLPLMIGLLSALTVSRIAAAQDSAVVPATNTVVVVGTNDAAAAPLAPAAAPAATSPGQSHVSHIQGQLVPVGKHNEYRHSFKKTLIATNPVGLLLGFIGLSVSHAVTKNIAVRGDANIIRNHFDPNESVMREFGLSAPIYLRRTYQGPFIEPGVIVRIEENCSEECRTTHTQVGPSIVAGYQVTYDSGLSVAVALGVHRDINAVRGEGDSTLPAGYFRVGYAF